MLEQAFITIAGLSVIAAVMVVLALVLKGLLGASHGAVGRSAFVLMWLLILGRAVLPVTVEVPTAVSSAVWREDISPLQRLYQAALPNGADFSAPFAPVNDLGAVAEPQEALAVTAEPAATVAAATVVPALNVSPGTEGAGGGDHASAHAPAAALSPAGTVTAPPAGGWQFVLRYGCLLWALVAAVLLLALGVTYLRTLRRVRRLPDAELPDDFAALKARFGVKRTVQIKRGPPGGAAVYGIFKPIIVLDNGNPAYREHILAHELVHIRRQDNLKQLFARLVIALHWFNPLLWLAGRLLRQDIELACDQQVLKILGCTQKKAYAGSLYDCARQQTAASRGFAYFSKNPIRARVKNVLAFRGKTVTTPVVAITLAVFLLSGCIANPAASRTRNGGDSEPAAPVAAAVTGYEADHAFYDLQLPREAGLEIVGYYPADGLIYYVYNNLNSDSYGLGYSELATGNNQWLFTGYGKTAYGRMHLAAGRLYYCVRDGAGQTELMSYDIDGRQAESVTATNDPEQAALLYGDEQYLCWYEGSDLVIRDLTTAAAKARLRTNGAQDYANVLDGHVALQRDSASASGGIEVVRYHIASGAELKVGSILPETCSVYANADYIVYKEEYKRGAEIAVYRAQDDETYLLWDALAAGVSAAEAAAWRAGAWGINLLHDRLFLTGVNNAVLVVKLDDFSAELLTDGDNHNSGFFEAQVCGDHLAAVQALPDKTGLNRVLNSREPRLFYATVAPVYAANQE